jgi:hypothetical protein
VDARKRFTNTRRQGSRSPIFAHHMSFHNVLSVIASNSTDAVVYMDLLVRHNDPS